MEPVVAVENNPVLAFFIRYGIPALIVALLAAAAFASKWLRESSSGAKGLKVIAIFTELARSAVAELEVTARPMLSDGRLTKEEGMKLKVQALDVLRKQAPLAVLKAAEE